MKKLIQICSLLGLLVAFTFVSANAQTVERYEANIPFEFNLGGKTFEAGTYVLKISRVPGGKLLSLEDNHKNYLQQSLVFEGGRVAEKNSQLSFTRFGNEWGLSKIMTTETNFNLPMTKAQKQFAKNQINDAKANANVVSVDLK